MNKVNQFLISLCLDQEKLERFYRDPDGVLNETSLSTEEKDLIKSRNASQIRLATFQKPKGSLIVVGTGIRLVSQITTEAENAIRYADRVLYACAEGAESQWIEMLNPRSESLDLLLQFDQPRTVTYRQTVDRILACVRFGYRVCVVFYGHPGVFAYAPHESIRRARIEGFSAVMLPAISAEDCLFADLGVDPGHGYQSFEATDFLIHRKRISVFNLVVFWQIGMIGEAGYKKSPNVTGLRALVETLCSMYPKNHPVVVYEASQYPITPPIIQKVQLSDLETAQISAYSTLFVPPLQIPKANSAILQRLGLPERQ
jgi:precorrin-3B methylase